MRIKKSLPVILFILTWFSSCQSSFDQKIWLNNDNIEDTNNPRASMVKDLMDNYLINGMKKEEIISLLGKPSSDTLGVYIPKGLKLPDSLDLLKSKVESQKALELVNEWFKKNNKEAHLLYYSIGWSIIDPIWLIIKLDKDNLMDDYWIEEH